MPSHPVISTVMFLAHKKDIARVFKWLFVKSVSENAFPNMPLDFRWKEFVVEFLFITQEWTDSFVSLLLLSLIFTFSWFEIKYSDL